MMFCAAVVAVHPPSLQRAGTAGSTAVTWMFPAWPAEPSPGRVTRHSPGFVNGATVFTAAGAEELNCAATAEPFQRTYPNAWGAGRYWALYPKVTENHE